MSVAGIQSSATCASTSERVGTRKFDVELTPLYSGSWYATMYHSAYILAVRGFPFHGPTPDEIRGILSRV